MSESAPQVRELVKEMRDEERSIEGGPQVCCLLGLVGFPAWSWVVEEN